MIPWWWYETKRNEMKKNLFIFNVGYFNRMCLHSSESNEFFFLKIKILSIVLYFFQFRFRFRFYHHHHHMFLLGSNFRFGGLILVLTPRFNNDHHHHYERKIRKNIILLNDIFQCQIFFQLKKYSLKFMKTTKNNNKIWPGNHQYFNWIFFHLKWSTLFFKKKWLTLCCFYGFYLLVVYIPPSSFK